MKKLMDWYLRFYPTVGTPPARRLKIHLCYWLFYFLFSYFSFIEGFGTIDKIVISSHLVILGAILFYIPSYFALPLLFTTRQFYLGIFLFVFTYILQHLERLGFNTLILKYNLHPPNGFTMANVQEFVDAGLSGMLSPKNLFREVYFASQALIIPFFLKFSRMLLFNSMNNKRITLEKSQIEIDYLRSQINPHFLLNTINNIYSQIITNDQTAPESIIALSNLMKYLLHRAKEASISLDEELDFIESYINWEQLKDSKKNKITFSKTGESHHLTIAPLMLINFIENAFKHVGSRNNDQGTILVQMNVVKNTLECHIQNSKGQDIQERAEKKEGGLGLKNVSQRLNLLYPNSHKLYITDTDEYFTVNLTIQLNS